MLFNFFKRSVPDYGRLKLYNTLSGEIETFTPLREGRVGMYVCGPTVYHYAHLGNLRAFLTPDILRRTLEHDGFSVREIINITDVGHLVGDGDEGVDKMEVGASRERKSALEIANYFTDAFMQDLHRLNIETDETKFPRATEHIPEQISLIEELEERGYAYTTSDGVYFDTGKLTDYGKLARLNIRKLKEGARVTANPEKRNPTDFALWKFSPKGEKRKQEWESPWGVGFPGWHIECSAMSMKYLGESFDIHTGGIDHIPVHHTNEIAQSESATGETYAHYWVHTAFINVEGGKMAKSEGNFLRLQSIIDEKIDPLAYRYWLLTSHYRSPVNFSMDAVRGCGQALHRLYEFFKSLPDEGRDPDQAYLAAFFAAIHNDLNTPQALATVWELIKDADVPAPIKRTTLLVMDSVLGLQIHEAISTPIPQEIHTLAMQREAARISNNYQKADQLRAQIEKAGYTVKDTAQGPSIIKS